MGKMYKMAKLYKMGKLYFQTSPDKFKIRSSLWVQMRYNKSLQTADTIKRADYADCNLDVDN